MEMLMTLILKCNWELYLRVLNDHHIRELPKSQTLTKINIYIDIFCSGIWQKLVQNVLQYKHDNLLSLTWKMETGPFQKNDRRLCLYDYVKIWKRFLNRLFNQQLLASSVTLALTWPRCNDNISCRILCIRYQQYRQCTSMNHNYYTQIMLWRNN